MEATTMAFALRGEGSDTLEIDVYDVIGDGGLFGGGVSAKKVRELLKDSQKASTIRLRINSRGGDVVDGFAIYNLLSEHPARVEADVDALAASMASVIMMAADEIRISESAFVMVHNPWGLAMGDSDDLRAQADVLDKMREQIAGAYVARTGLDRGKVREMMDAETWMSASEAKASGFVDTVKPSKKREAARAMAALNLAGLRAPERLLAAVAQARVMVAQVNDGARRAEENSMNEEQILKALGVKTLAEAQVRLARLDKIEAAAGKAGDEAQGLVLAALNSHSELPKAQARIAELEQQTALSAIDKLIAKAKDDKKWTPAIEASVREAFAAKEVTLKGVEAWLGNLAPIAAFAAPLKSEGRVTGAQPDLKHNGKTYAELAPVEKAQLKRENPELFAAMRSASN